MSSNQKMLDEIAALSERVKADFEGASTQMETFASGAAMLDVHWRGRLFVLAYYPKGGFGVDEVGEDEGFEMGYHFLSKEFEAAANELYRLLGAAQ